ncbi:MAG: SusC/RagA family TonB-linked outer membrane protein [Sediminibacterium sp.]|jgi:TonB-linked SusC/RagA family outer membrane protein|nr:MAG: SusC/RagA family TonB-linked outer membrane protein [Sediminibacterium sp.]
MRKFVATLLCAILVVTQVAAQNKTIRGRVTEDGKKPLSNASIIVKGTNVASKTNEEGYYSITIPANGKVLKFSSLNFEDQEVNIGSKSEINVILANTVSELQQVIVTGYGTTKKATNTGSIATVKAADIENLPFSSVDKALQGKVAGLQSVASSGQPGASQAILIRGASSITASNAPLWVVDGVPINAGDASRLQTTGNLLSTLNPNDIESISVLKDAASQSIYGSRAANGVIVVTTKKGKSGKTKFRFDTELGNSDVAYVNQKYKPLDANEYINITREGLVNAGYSTAQINSTVSSLGEGNGTNFNWFDNIMRVGQQKQYNLSAEGGNDKTTFFLSGGHFAQEGTSINSQLKRTNVNVRITNKATDKLTVGFNLNAGNVNQRAPLAGGAFGNPLLSTYFLLPTYSAYNPDGTYNYVLNGGLHNTIALAELDKRFLRQTSARGSVNGEYKILDNLKFKSVYGIDYNGLEEDQYNNPIHGDGRASNGRAFAYYTRYFNYVWTNTLDLQQNITSNGDLSTSTQIGYEAQKSSGYFSSLQAQQFPPSLSLTWPASGASPTTSSATISEYTFESQFASTNLNYKNRFVLSGSFRRDGSSRFSAKNRYGNFWALGATWNIDREEFMTNNTLFDQLKLRGSYGVNGNAGIGNYDAPALYGFGFNYNQLPGSGPTNVGDENLTWELNKPFNIGLDFSILKNRVNVTVDAYIRKSENLLLSVPLSNTSGFGAATRNIGSMENKGIELSINLVPIQTKDLRWDLDFNFSNNKNKITSLPNQADILSGNFIIREGQSLNTFFLREWAGVDRSTGDPQWYVTDQHQASSNIYPGANARILAGQALPKFFGSLTNALSYKGFNLSAQLYYNFGNQVYDTWRGYYLGSGFGATFNKVKRQLDAWRKPGDITNVPRYVYNGNKNFSGASTYNLNDGSFVRVRDIQLGYTLPKAYAEKLKIGSANIYVRGTNLFTWVKDENLPFDPEQGTASASNLNVFIPKTITVGLSLAF